MTNKKTAAQLQQELNEVLAWFESQDINLDEAVAKYKRGNELIALLQKQLEEAKISINVISKQ